MTFICFDYNAGNLSGPDTFSDGLFYWNSCNNVAKYSSVAKYLASGRVIGMQKTNSLLSFYITLLAKLKKSL